MINGYEYGYQDIRIYFLGKEVVGATSITYKTTREKENVYARGSKPVARRRGQKVYEGSIGLLQSELEALAVRAGKNKDITDIGMFDVIVTYAPEDGNGVIITDILKDCEFTEVEKAMSSGDMSMEIELPIIIGDIKYSTTKP